MAKKATDSNSSNEALSAVEDALKIDFDTNNNDLDKSAASVDEAAAALGSSVKSEEETPTPPRAENREVVSPSSRPANDMHQSGLAKFRATMARKPSSATIWFAILLSLLWIGAAGWAGFKLYGNEVLEPNAWVNLIDRPNLIYLAGSVILPLLVIWAFALMIRRAQELKLAARSMTEVAYRLIEPESEAVGAVRTVGQAVKREVDALTDGVEKAMNRAGELETLVHNEVVTLTSSYSENEMRMQGLVEELAQEREAIVTHSERVRSSITGASDALKEDLSLSAGEISTAVESARQNFAMSLSTTNEEVKATLKYAGETLLDSINVTSGEIGDRISQAGDDLLGRISTAGEQTSGAIEQKTTELGERIDFLSNQMETSVTGRMEQVITQLDERSKALEDNVDKIDTALEGRTRQISDTLVERTREIATAFATGQQAINTDFASQLDQTQEMLDNKALELSVSLATRVEEINQSIVAQVDDVETRLAKRSEEVKSTFDEQTGAIDLVLGTRMDAIHASLEAGADKVSNSLGEKARELSALLDSNLNGIAATLTAESTKAEAAVAASIAAMEGQIGDQVMRADTALAKRTEHVTKSLAERTAELNTTLAARSRELSNLLTRDTMPLLEDFELRGQTVADLIAEQMRTSADVAVETLQNAISGSNERMEEAAQAAAEDLATRYLSIEGKTAELVSQLAQSSDGLSNVVESQSERLVSDGDAMTRKMAEVAEEVSEKVRAESAAMVNVLTAKSNETLAALGETNEKLAGDVGELLGRLDRSNGTLSELITSADTNLSRAQSLLAERAEEFQSTVGRASDDLNSSSNLIEANYLGLKDVSATVLVEISEIANRFSEQSDALNAVSRLLDDTQSNIAISLDDRRDAIEALTNGLVVKSSELEELMRRFSDMMTESVTSAEGRARTLTDGLAESVGAAANEATERFSAATQDMRQSAHDLRQDLARTRDDLKKSVIDLPDETRESTNAMRRVVSDQIKALKDLNDIVSKTARYQDAAPSNVATPSAGVASLVPPAAPPRQPQPQSARPAPKPPIPVKQPAPTPAPASAGLRGAFEFDGASQSAGAAAPTSGAGWVSDLLRRASQDDTAADSSPRARARENDSLNSLSTEIAQSIDHDAAVDLWDRYQRGQRNVFSRNIYTAQGRETFDDISAKYRGDAKFKDSVDRYVADFERLIADVSKNDRDNIMTQTYLVSDTGKVYTMLAHAAGRFG